MTRQEWCDWYELWPWDLIKFSLVCILMLFLLLGILATVANSYNNPSHDRLIERGKRKAITEFYENIGYEQKMNELQQSARNP